MMMHEISEAYQGGLISKNKRISSPQSGFKGSIYEEAHRKATPQTIIRQRWYDEYGRETLDNKNVMIRKYFVKDLLGNERIIQTYNRNER